ESARGLRSPAVPQSRSPAVYCGTARPSWGPSTSWATIRDRVASSAITPASRSKGLCMPDSDTDIDTALDAVPAVSSVSSVSSVAPITSAFDVAAARAPFPSLALEQDGRPVVFADNPGGTQVTRECMEAITAYLTPSNANIGSAFLTSHRTDAML